ncbi:MAG: nitroreductase family protein [Gammaproteobacteria bacterium]|nr:nitroreductase family protein [Gammaproteobacteria bacterium]
MKKWLFTLFSTEQKAAVKSRLLEINFFLIRLFAHRALLSSLYYFLFSRQFDREHKAVLQGRMLYQGSLSQIGRSSALLRRNIHRLEKGLIMQPRRAVFATDYINETVAVYLKAVQQATLCEAELKWATDVLTEYFTVVQYNAVIAKARAMFSSASKPAAAATSIPYAYQTLPSAAVSFADLSALFLRRRSVRWYQQKAVEPELIRQAVNIATLAPSACNRQPYRFDLLSNPLDAADIARCAMGTTGFADNIPCLIVVVGDLSCYPAERDRHVIYIDASLAAMQLMLALETLGLSTCPINWPDIEQREAILQQKLGLAYHERPVMLMAVGYADPQGGIAFSQKKTDELLVRDVRISSG